MNMKWIFLSLVTFCLLTGCASSKKVNTAGTTPLYVPKQTGTEKKDSTHHANQKKDTATSQVEVKTPKDSIVNIETKEEKTSFNIAVILPFSSNKVPLDYTPYDIKADIDIQPNALRSLEFYLGVNQAVQEFKTFQKKINVFVLDQDNVGYQFNLLKQRPFPEVDVIVTGDQYGVSSDLIRFSNQHQVPLYNVSGANPSMPSEEVFSVQPNQLNLIQQLLVKAKSVYPDAEIDIIQNPVEDSSRILVNAASKFIQDEMGLKARIIPNNTADAVDSTSFYSSYASNIVLIASNNERFVKRTIHQLNLNLFPPYIIGTPSWIKFKSIKTDNSGNPIWIPSFRFVNENLAARDNLGRKILEDSGIKATINTYLGYDLMNYILKSLDKGALGENQTSKQLGLKPLMYRFNFIPFVSGGEMQFFVNDEVDFLRYDGSKFVKSSF